METEGERIYTSEGALVMLVLVANTELMYSWQVITEWISDGIIYTSGDSYCWIPVWEKFLFHFGWWWMRELISNIWHKVPF